MQSMNIFTPEGKVIDASNPDVFNLVSHFTTYDTLENDFFSIPLYSIQIDNIDVYKFNYNGKQIVLPASSEILVYDDETSSVDLVSPEESIVGNFNILGIDFKNDKIFSVDLKLDSYQEHYEYKSVVIQENKLMPCIGIGDDKFVIVSFNPNINIKQIEYLTAGELI